ncbi:hypothetical protein QJS66_06075 [Kocuria rhizophila]|nr:hypothetical protein QJS66_06075 [Kocuria rhizophila]
MEKGDRQRRRVTSPGGPPPAVHLRRDGVGRLEPAASTADAFSWWARGVAGGRGPLMVPLAALRAVLPSTVISPALLRWPWRCLTRTDARGARGVTAGAPWTCRRSQDRGAALREVREPRATRHALLRTARQEVRTSDCRVARPPAGEQVESMTTAPPMVQPTTVVAQDLSQPKLSAGGDLTTDHGTWWNPHPDADDLNGRLHDQEIHIHDLGVITDAVLPRARVRPRARPGPEDDGGHGLGRSWATARTPARCARAAPGARGGDRRARRWTTWCGLVEESGGTVDREEVGRRRSADPDLTHRLAEGRRAHVGGPAGPVETLAAVGEPLVAVHGQSDQLRLKLAGRSARPWTTTRAAGFAAELACTGRSSPATAASSPPCGPPRRTPANARCRRKLDHSPRGNDAAEPVPGEDTQLDARARSSPTWSPAHRGHHRARGPQRFRGRRRPAGEPTWPCCPTPSRPSSWSPLRGPGPRWCSQPVCAADRGRRDVAADLSGYASGLDEDGPARLAGGPGPRQRAARSDQEYVPRSTRR